MKMNEKNIVLECYSISLFWSFNEDNKKSISLFESLSERELNGWGDSFLSILLKSQFFIPSKIVKNWRCGDAGPNI